MNRPSRVFYEAERGAWGLPGIGRGAWGWSGSGMQASRFIYVDEAFDEPGIGSRGVRSPVSTITAGMDGCGPVLRLRPLRFLMTGIPEQVCQCLPPEEGKRAEPPVRGGISVGRES